MIEVLKFKKEHENAKAPLRAHSTDAGADLSTVRDEEIKPFECKLIDLGVSFDIPEGYMIMLAARSSLPLKKHLMLANGIGVIDEDYTGEVKAQLLNISNKTVKLKAGERIAQAILTKVETPRLLETTKLKETQRGAKGFGSTNKG